MTPKSFENLLTPPPQYEGPYRGFSARMHAAGRYSGGQALGSSVRKTVVETGGSAHDGPMGARFARDHEPVSGLEGELTGTLIYHRRLT